MQDHPEVITEMILKAKAKAERETGSRPEPELTKKVRWPVDCNVGPGLEGAIACESKVGYVNGSKGSLIYRGYNIFDLAAHSSFEEVSYLLIHGKLPGPLRLARFKAELARYRPLPHALRSLMSFPVEQMNAMAALRIGTMMMRQHQTFRDQEEARPNLATAISADEDSIPMETKPHGEADAIYKFKQRVRKGEVKSVPHRPHRLVDAAGLASAYHLIAGVATLAASIARLRQGKMPIEPDPGLSHAANLIYMMTGRHPTPLEERVMDVALILHADHGMNASTFASLVVASTLSDIYFSVGAGIAALNGPLHGGANEEVLRTLESIGGPENVDRWFENAMAHRQKIVGFGHRVYKAYDPRARILGPLAKYLAKGKKQTRTLVKTAQALERRVIATLGAEKKVFTNVDYYSGLVYASLGIEREMFTPLFAVSRVSGWTARLIEYLRNNRIFRPRAMYTGPFDREYVPLEQRVRK
jgi:citrate synthase